MPTCGTENVELDACRPLSEVILACCTPRYDYDETIDIEDICRIEGGRGE